MSSVMSYPYGICNLDCIGYREIGCEHCDKWYHFSCENLKVKDFTFLSKTTLPYTYVYVLNALITQIPNNLTMIWH